MTDIINWLLTSVQGLGWGARDLIAGLAILMETSLFVGLIMPGDTVVLVAATGVQNFPDFLGLLACVVAGSLVGESIGFWVGRTFGMRIRRSRLGVRIGENNWQIADRFVETRGGVAVAVSRFLPVLHSLVPVTAGMTRMRYSSFIRWTLGACTVWASAYVGVGWLAHKAYDQYLSNLKLGGLIFAGLVIVVLVVVRLVKKRLENTAERMIASTEAAAELAAEPSSDPNLENNQLGGL
ncbi:MAG: hypothetical protein RL508_142 [Actinomycetota bacterium]|jgi:membrane-associated protein